MARLQMVHMGLGQYCMARLSWRRSGQGNARGRKWVARWGHAVEKKRRRMIIGAWPDVGRAVWEKAHVGHP